MTGRAKETREVQLRVGSFFLFSHFLASLKKAVDKLYQPCLFHKQRLIIVNGKYMVWKVYVFVLFYGNLSTFTVSEHVVFLDNEMIIQ